MHASEFLLKLKGLNPEELKEIKGLGDVLIENIQEFTNSPRYVKMVAEFQALEEKVKGITITKTIKIDKSGLPLFGKIICITGGFDISRDAIKTQLEVRGATVVDAITSSTNLLLAGEKAGSKMEKARAKSIEIQNDYKVLLEK